MERCPGGQEGRGHSRRVISQDCRIGSCREAKWGSKIKWSEWLERTEPIVEEADRSLANYTWNFGLEAGLMIRFALGMVAPAKPLSHSLVVDKMEWIVLNTTNPFERVGAALFTSKINLNRPRKQHRSKFQGNESLVYGSDGGFVMGK